VIQNADEHVFLNFFVLAVEVSEQPAQLGHHVPHRALPPTRRRHGGNGGGWRRCSGGARLRLALSPHALLPAVAVLLARGGAGARWPWTHRVVLGGGPHPAWGGSTALIPRPAPSSPEPEPRGAPSPLLPPHLERGWTPRLRGLAVRRGLGGGSKEEVGAGTTEEEEEVGVDGGSEEELGVEFRAAVSCKLQAMKDEHLVFGGEENETDIYITEETNRSAVLVLCSRMFSNVLKPIFSLSAQLRPRLEIPSVGTFSGDILKFCC
jgi:hypothetical protein